MNNLKNQEYTDDQLLVDPMLLHAIMQKISEEPGIKFDAFDLQADKKSNQHILVIWKNGEKLEPIMILNKQIADCSLSEENQEEMKQFLNIEVIEIREKTNVE